MRILAFDTATEACSVALRVAGGDIWRSVEAGRGHAERILAMIDEVLVEAGLTLRQLDGIAASIGPGSFTGVRISIAVAQGLAFGAGLPVIPVTTLEALALERLAPSTGAMPGTGAGGSSAASPAAPPAASRGELRGESRDATPVALACLDARMGEIYWGCYVSDARRGVRALAAPRLSAPAALDAPAPRTLGIGRGFRAYPELAARAGLVLDQASCAALPDARAMARLGIIRLAAGEGADPATLEPLYLRDRVALTAAERRG
jgi:tRNA threonylcarbamoyladenosine biosynthesis protein TsaB